MSIKDELKNSLTIDEVEEYLVNLSADPINKGSYLICKTICHHSLDEEMSHKLYYYDNTKLFKCFTHCDPDTFDIFELTMKVHGVSFYGAINEVNSFFGNRFQEVQDDGGADSIEDWNLFNRYEALSRSDHPIQLESYDNKILRFFPRPRILNWEKEGIHKDIMDEHNICFNPMRDVILIPHYDIDNRLIGIKERTVVIEEERNGKYKPAIINKKQYNFPTGLALYNLNYVKDNIKLAKKVIVFESEKGTLQFRSAVGKDNDISVACCGSTLTKHQLDLLLNLGVKEITLAFDRDYKEVGDDVWKKLVKKYEGAYQRYGSLVQFSFIVDLKNELGLKDSPIDKGIDVFMDLYRKRVIL